MAVKKKTTKKTPTKQPAAKKKVTKKKVSAKDAAAKQAGKKTRIKASDTSALPHGRKAVKDGSVCGSCRWLDIPNAEIGNPLAGCRLSRGCKTKTTACADQYERSGQEVSEKAMAKILKKTRGRIILGSVANAGACITSGLLTSDLVTGGGQAPGRVYVKAGRPHSGKTTEYSETIGHALSMGVPVYHFDAEGAVDWDYTERAVRKWGVEMEWDASLQSWTHPLLMNVDFESGDEFFEWLAWTLKELPDYSVGPPSMYVICDSAANLTPKALAEDPSKNPMAQQARMFSTGFQVSRSLLKRKGGVLGFTNHIKEKPGVVFGSPEYMSGGTALHHHADIIEWMRGRSSGMPQPAVKAKGRRVEKSWTGDGKDFFMYAAHAFKKNRRSGSSVDMTWGRICFKEAGGPGTGVDRAFDVFQYLCMTGQAEWLGRERIELNLHMPVIKGDEVKHPKLKGYYGKQMAWRDFRVMVLAEAYTPGSTKLDLYRLCRNQMATGFGFRRYRKMTKDIE